jgi:hypothetical protein
MIQHPNIVVVSDEYQAVFANRQRVWRVKFGKFRPAIRAIDISLRFHLASDGFDRFLYFFQINGRSVSFMEYALLRV